MWFATPTWDATTQNEQASKRERGFLQHTNVGTMQKTKRNDKKGKKRAKVLHLYVDM